MSSENLLYNIGISLIDNVGDIVAKKLIAYCGSSEAVFKESKGKLLKIPDIGSTVASSIVSQNVLSRAEEEIKFISKNKITPLFYLDADYPQRLYHCDDGPIMLYTEGNMNLNSKRSVSIVGTRNATDYGKRMCNEIVEGLAALDVLIVSGLAYGIDICAHKAAVDNKIPTIAVVAHGQDRIYPGSHKSTMNKMYENGGMVTEFISNTIPDRENFPKRNRIIAGLSDAVIVIESAKRGGALITAEIGNSYNRDVFAIPGRLGSKYSEGCNWLIKVNRGALLESVKDLEYIMGWESQDKKQEAIQKKIFVELAPSEKVLIEIIRKGSIGIDILSLEAKMSTSMVSALLLNLEFAGVVKCMPGKMYQMN